MAVCVRVLWFAPILAIEMAPIRVDRRARGIKRKDPTKAKGNVGRRKYGTKCLSDLPKPKPKQAQCWKDPAFEHLAAMKDRLTSTECG